MKTIDSIPTSKIRRASKLVRTGAQVGVNYLKYYGDRVTGVKEAREKLDERNAEDIYDSLKQLKGSALKVAQMLSMEKSLLPRQYVERFSLAQFSVPPLSPALVRHTFKKYFGKLPEQIFDTFDSQAINAASIGQVHKARKGGQCLAVKIQYPGVAESISSDLALVKPIALRMFNIQSKDSEKYFAEVEDKLLEETDYILEVHRSKELSQACSHIPNIEFPTYYPQWSSERVITMDWMEGTHLSEYTKQSENIEEADRLGQALWDFYMYQIHALKKVHADPHPGNFLVSDNGGLIAIDFGCIKEIPDDFYVPYFEICNKNVLKDDQLFSEKLFELEILRKHDTGREKRFINDLFRELLSLTTLPLNAQYFDFTDETFLERIADLGQRYTKATEMKKMNANRGSRHFIYLNRTFFGLYSLMFDLKARNVEINRYKQFMAPREQ